MTRSWFDENLSVLRVSQPEAAAVLAPLGPRASPEDGATLIFETGGGRALLEPGPSDLPALSLDGPGGRRRLASAISPEAEDSRLVERFLEGAPPPEEGLTLMGLGLGFAAERLAGLLPPEARLWLLEARPELAAALMAARDLRSLLSRPGLTLQIGPRRYLPSAAPKTVLARPANLRLDPDLYPDPPGLNSPGLAPPGLNRQPNPHPVPARPSPARQGLDHPGPDHPGLARPGLDHPGSDRPGLARPGLARPGPAPAASAVHQAPRPAAGQAPRLLFLDAGYFLSRELILAAKALGSEVALWPIPSGLTANEDDYRRLLATIREARPELVLTVNHLGFDAEGLLASILKRLSIPAASWFVDSPSVILGGADLGDDPDVFVFAWDRDHIPILAQMGFRAPSFLPLASSEAFFRAPARPPKIKRQIAFVGDSLRDATGKYLALSGLSAELLPRLDELAVELKKSKEPTAKRVASPMARELSLDAAQTLALEALITWRASRLARLEVLRFMPAGKLTVAGDPGWADLVPGARLHGRVDYYGPLRGFYQASAVNLNITSAQMPTGLNQRVFDVPAARAFLLTDHKSQLDELFEPGAETASYHDPAEAAELAEWYLARPAERERIAYAASRRTLSNHLYRHRLRELFRRVGLRARR